jgi:rfaE bifunctional protein nucleotidyltransferase chain/domain
MSPSLATEADIARAVEEARAAGRTVVFTNGTFDLLHAGHLRVLEGAAAEGDLLIVAVNDDESVRRLRGPSKPVMPAADRAALVGALRCVDHVFLFPDVTVDRLLEHLRPDVHAKGTDYDDTTLPERETNARLGIRSAFVGGAKTHSASALLARVAAAAVGGDRVRTWGSHGVVLARAWPLLEAQRWLDLERLATTTEGTLVEGTTKRWVRRVVIEGTPLFLKVTHPFERKRSALVEFKNHLLLRAAGFRAPEPWLAASGQVGEGTVGVLATREAPGVRLDHWLRDHLPACRARERTAIAHGIGRALRALYTARFLYPDLQAWHLLVDGSPIGGRSSITFIDLMRLDRSAKDVTPAQAAPGLAALALSLAPVADRRFRLSILRALLGGSLRQARPWLQAIERRIARVKDRGTFRHLEVAP